MRTVISTEVFSSCSRSSSRKTQKGRLSFKPRSLSTVRRGGTTSLTSLRCPVLESRVISKCTLPVTGLWWVHPEYSLLDYPLTCSYVNLGFDPMWIFSMVETCMFRNHCIRRYIVTRCWGGSILGCATVFRVRIPAGLNPGGFHRISGSTYTWWCGKNE